MCHFYLNIYVSIARYQPEPHELSFLDVKKLYIKYVCVHYLKSENIYFVFIRTNLNFEKQFGIPSNIFLFNLAYIYKNCSR